MCSKASHDLMAAVAANPGALAVLSQESVDVSELAWKLASTLPAIISIGFNPSVTPRGAQPSALAI